MDTEPAFSHRLDFLELALEHLEFYLVRYHHRHDCSFLWHNLFCSPPVRWSFLDHFPWTPFSVHYFRWPSFALNNYFLLGYGIPCFLCGFNQSDMGSHSLNASALRQNILSVGWNSNLYIILGSHIAHIWSGVNSK